MASNLTERVGKLVEARQLMLSGLAPMLETLKDTSIPLDERWQAYTTLVENDILTKNESYGDGFIDTLSDNLTQYDDFNNDRHTTVRFLDMYEHIMEADPRWDPTLVKVRAGGNLAKWQEQVLASGFASFTNDW